MRLFADAAIALALDFPATVDPAAAAGNIVFKIGLDVRWYGREYRIANLATTSDGVERVMLSLAADGSTVWISRSDLLKDAKARQFAVFVTSEVNALTFLGSTKSTAEDRQLAKNLVIAHRLRGGATPVTRQERRIAIAIQEAAAAGRSLAEQLQPKLHKRGWHGDEDGMRMPDRDPAVAAEHKAFLKDQIATFAKDSAAGTIASHYDRYADAAADKGYSPVSLETFRRRVHTLPTAETTEGREGRRAANAIAPAQRSRSAISVKSPRAQGEVLVDHTKLAVMMVAVRGTRIYPIGRAWLTLAVCSYSTKVMKHVLLCDEPSQGTLQLLARGYVDLHGRLPDAWSHDNGREFGSWFWTLLNADRGVDMISHPVAHSRFGSEVELTFGALDQRLWNNILGGTKAVAHRRRDVDQLITEWMEAHNNTPLAGIQRTPNELYDESMRTVGRAPEREITPGRDWDWFSLPRPVRVGMLRVRRGEVRIKGVTYTSSELAELPDNTMVEVRYDPFDRSRGMARVKDNPVYLKASERYDFLSHISERERRYASQEATKALGRRAKAEAYAEFMRSVIERQESLRALRAGDQRMLLEANGQFAKPAAALPASTTAATAGAIEDITLAAVEGELAEVSA